MAPGKKNRKKGSSMDERKEVSQGEIDALTQQLSVLQAEEEELKSKIEINKAKIDLWREILKAKTGTEIEEVVSNSPIDNLRLLTEDSREKLNAYKRLEGSLRTYASSGIMAKLAPDGDTLVQFIPTKKNKFPESLLLKLSHNKEDNTFSVADHNLHDFVPIDELVEDYLSGSGANVKIFITKVAMHTSKLIKRHNMFQDIKDRMLRNIYYNPDRTKLCLELPLEQDVSDTTNFEVILKYKPLEIMPYSVTAEHFDGVKPNDEINELVSNLVEELYEVPVNEAIYKNVCEVSEVGEATGNTGSLEGSQFSNILEGEA